MIEQDTSTLSQEQSQPLLANPWNGENYSSQVSLGGEDKELKKIQDEQKEDEKKVSSVQERPPTPQVASQVASLTSHDYHVLDRMRTSKCFTNASDWHTKTVKKLKYFILFLWLLSLPLFVQFGYRFLDEGIGTDVERYAAPEGSPRYVLIIDSSKILFYVPEPL